MRGSHGGGGGAGGADGRSAGWTQKAVTESSTGVNAAVLHELGPFLLDPKADSEDIHERLFRGNSAAQPRPEVDGDAARPRVGLHQRGLA